MDGRAARGSPRRWRRRDGALPRAHRLPRDRRGGAGRPALRPKPPRPQRFARHRSDAELLACECVSNAIRFTRSGARGGRVAVKLLGLDDALRVEILNEGGASSIPAPRGNPDSDEAESGRGLHLIDALAKEWGSMSYGPGTLTWFTIART